MANDSNFDTQGNEWYTHYLCTSGRYLQGLDPYFESRWKRSADGGAEIYPTKKRELKMRLCDRIISKLFLACLQILEVVCGTSYVLRKATSLQHQEFPQQITTKQSEY